MKEIYSIIIDSNISQYPFPPFSPDKKYPEYQFNHIQNNNLVYSNIRKLFYHCGMDRDNFDKKNWNPLGEIIFPGNKVLIKPNIVKNEHPLDNDLFSIITHSSVIRAVLDFVFIALGENGTVIIGDAPIQGTDFKKAVINSGIKDIKDFYEQKTEFNFEIIDFRIEQSVKEEGIPVIKRLKNYQGFTTINLGSRSCHNAINKDYKYFRVTNYDKKKMFLHHSLEKHEYLISNVALNADVILNLPKLKTHRKAGITCGLKNLIGVNVSKDCLPHHRYGSKEEGRDEYLNTSLLKKINTILMEKQDELVYQNNKKEIKLFIILRDINSLLLKLFTKDNYSEGSWYGNDTLWRTILDINRIIKYADKNGNMTDKCQRRIFTVVDSIIAGEGEGPIYPKPKKCGMLLCGENQVMIDLLVAKIIGFDMKKIPQIINSELLEDWPISTNSIKTISIFLNGQRKSIDEIQKIFDFDPPNGWKGHIEND